MNRKKKIICILTIEILILIVMVILLIVRWRSSQAIDVPITDWESDYVEYDDINGWFIDEKLLKTEDEDNIDLVHSPLISLQKGTYRIIMEYHCDYNQSCLAYSEETFFHLKAEEAILSRNYDQLTYDFEISGKVEDFEFLVRYDGNGYLQINHVSIVPSPFGLIKNISIVIFLFVCLDLCLLCSEKIKDNRNTLLALLGITLLVSIPLFTDGISNGHDLEFHLMRIEGIAREIRVGNIPVRMSSAWLDGYGYPVSIYYGDIFLYIPAIMSLVGFSLTSAYKFYIFMINMGTAIITYCCMRKICEDTRIALLISFAYCTASYRMVNVYVRAAVGEYSAMMFMPIVAVAIYKIYTDDVSNIKEYRKNAAFLAIGMSGLISTHALSTEMTVFVLIFICVSLFKLSVRKETIVVFLRAVVITLALSAYFIVPFVDYMINVPTRISWYVGSGKRCIQVWGMTISEFFTFFRHIDHTGMEVYANRRMFLSPGLILMVTLIIAIVLWAKNKGNKITNILVVYACILMIMALNIFPWDYIALHSSIGNMLAQVQFPWRYVGIMMVILTLLLVRLLQQISVDDIKLKIYGNVIIIAGFIMTCFFASDYIDNSVFISPYCGAELDSYDATSGGEYLLAGASIDNLTTDIYTNNIQDIDIISRKGSNMIVRCVASVEESSEGDIWFPMFNYKGYHVIDDKGNEFSINNSEVDRIHISSIPTDFDGYILVEFKEPWYWRAAELISLISIVILCAGKSQYVFTIR